MIDPRPLHRLFGLSWIDFFQGTTINVETEIDLSLKQQFLDMVIINKGAEPIPRPLPDGFEDLVAHNLVSFKSHQESLDAWALWELVGHFVNYRKQFSPSLDALLPLEDFRLFAVCARYPYKLAQRVELTADTGGRVRIEWVGVEHPHHCCASTAVARTQRHASPVWCP